MRGTDRDTVRGISESVKRRSGRRETQVLAFIRSTIAEHGQAPSYAMVCSALGIATRSEVHRIVKRLEEKGALRRAGLGKVRRIRMGGRG